MVKQGNIKYYFLSLWYDSTWDWTQVSRDSDVVKVLLFDTNYSIEHDSFVCTQSYSFKYCCVITIIQFRYIVKIFQVLLFNAKISMPH